MDKQMLLELQNLLKKAIIRLLLKINSFPEYYNSTNLFEELSELYFEEIQQVNAIENNQVIKFPKQQVNQIIPLNNFFLCNSHEIANYFNLANDTVRYSRSRSNTHGMMSMMECDSNTNYFDQIVNSSAYLFSQIIGKNGTISPETIRNFIRTKPYEYTKLLSVIDVAQQKILEIEKMPEILTLDKSNEKIVWKDSKPKLIKLLQILIKEEYLEDFDILDTNQWFTINGIQVHELEANYHFKSKSLLWMKTDRLLCYFLLYLYNNDIIGKFTNKSVIHFFSTYQRKSNAKDPEKAIASQLSIVRNEKRDPIAGEDELQDLLYKIL